MREATDLGIGAAVRRELAGRRIDLSKIKFPVKAGVVTLQGELAFVGSDKTADETAIELKFIESSLRQISGVKEVVFELAGWTQTDSGVWESAQSPITSSSTVAGSSAASGDGLYCDECDMVIRFCPCCGKPLVASAKSSARPRRSSLPVKPIIKKRPGFTPTTGSNLPSKKEPVAPTVGGMPTSSPTHATPFTPPAPIKPIAPAPATAKPIEPAKPTVVPAVPVISTSKPDVTPAAPMAPAPIKPGAAAPVLPAKPPTPAIKPAMPTAPVVSAPKPVITPVARPQAPVPAAAPQKPAAPAPAARPVAPPVSKPAPATSMPPVESPTDAADDMNFDNLNLDVEAPTKPGAPAAKPAAHAEPRPDFRKSDVLTDDLFGSLIDNLSQSGNASSSEQNDSEDFSLASEGSGTSAGENVPDINLSSLDDFAAPDSAAPEYASEEVADLLPPKKPAAPAVEPEPSLDEFADLLPPMKPVAAQPEPAMDEFADLLPPMKPKAPAATAARPRPAAKPAATNAEPDPFAGLDDTPLPPMKPAGSDSLEDDDTPLPPMRAKAPAGKESKDPFAALFSESDLGLGGSGGEGGKDPFASLDLDLDVLEVFPSDDQPAPPPAKPAPGGKKPAAAKPAAPVDDNPFNIDNIIDLDSPVEEKPKAGQKKPAKDPFDLDDFDIGKFKL